LGVVENTAAETSKLEDRRASYASVAGGTSFGNRGPRKGPFSVVGRGREVRGSSAFSITQPSVVERKRRYATVKLHTYADFALGGVDRPRNGTRAGAIGRA
jgi:hypothetical protein